MTKPLLKGLPLFEIVRMNKIIKSLEDLKYSLEYNGFHKYIIEEVNRSISELNCAINSIFRNEEYYEEKE